MATAKSKAARRSNTPKQPAATAPTVLQAQPIAPNDPLYARYRATLAAEYIAKTARAVKERQRPISANVASVAAYEAFKVSGIVSSMSRLNILLVDSSEALDRDALEKAIFCMSMIGSFRADYINHLLNGPEGPTSDYTDELENFAGAIGFKHAGGGA